MCIRDRYYSCILCQAFSPSHVCVVTPERLGLCGAVSWLDAKATNELDPNGPCQVITKERPIDENLGAYEDVDEMFSVTHESRCLNTAACHGCHFRECHSKRCHTCILTVCNNNAVREWLDTTDTLEASTGCHRILHNGVQCYICLLYTSYVYPMMILESLSFRSLISLARQRTAMISDATVMSYPSSRGIPFVLPPRPSITLRS